MFLISKALRPTFAQFFLGLTIATLLPLCIGYSSTRFHPWPDQIAHDRAAADIQQKIENTDNEAEKVYQTREKAILEERHAGEAQEFRRGMFWLAYPAGLLALSFGLFGLEGPHPRNHPQPLGPLQRAEEIERYESSLGQRLFRGWPFGLAIPFDVCLPLFVLIHRVQPIAWGLLLGGLSMVAMGCVISWPDLNPSQIYLCMLIVAAIFMAMGLRWYWMSESSLD